MLRRAPANRERFGRNNLLERDNDKSIEKCATR